MGQSIMVIDHDDAYLAMVEALLREEGYGDVRCANAARAGEAIDTARADVILLDIHVGIEAESWGALERIERSAANRDTPVIICTTDTRLAREWRGWVEHGGRGVLEKPFTIAELLGALAPIIGPPVRPA